ncbi:hypothetical protein E1B28_009346 [Marasmius oreades]|uniref:Uncharacterized protein n=1 Tax=Marasmius oreades TaxID=181124 RepID=A0A9P7S0T5_9AGAR|nr:uncharacterized protein E1B28_009346 [Marasmius oreades]KAG7093053.1 hypothetical protein E1B28_009346 [Marasmius oreades]
MSLSQFEGLPVELLYEIQLYALSEHLPHTSKRLYAVFKSAPTFLTAHYIYHRIPKGSKTSTDILNSILRYPICTAQTLQFIRTNLFLDDLTSNPELPKRLFRPLTTKKPPAKWRDTDHPLPFLEFLYDSDKLKIPAPNPNSHHGYALTKAVHVGFGELVKFLLERGATPKMEDRKKDGLTVMIAIRQKDLRMVKMLIERRDEEFRGTRKRGVNTGNKRRKMEDRISVTAEMLQMAVKCKAHDIAEYFMKEKGCVPDMKTLYMLS